MCADSTTITGIVDKNRLCTRGMAANFVSKASNQHFVAYLFTYCQQMFLLVHFVKLWLRSLRLFATLCWDAVICLISSGTDANVSYCC